MLRYKTETRPGLVTLYDIRPGNGVGQFLQPWSPHGVKHYLYSTATVQYVQTNFLQFNHQVTGKTKYTND